MTSQHRPHVVLGVTGSIAVYKSLELCRRLRAGQGRTGPGGARISVVMTDAAQKLVTPLAFETVAREPVNTDMWCRRSNIEDVEGKQIEHIDLAQSADLLLIAPATANIIGKVAGGIADDLLSTVIMATRAPVFFAPAMNDRMWANPVVQQNVARLKELGYAFVEPESGSLACGDEGPGRLASVETICEAVWDRLDGGRVLTGKHVVVSAGRTEEEIDPVRVLTNRSSGRMGFALAEAARRAGAKVTLVLGKTSAPAPTGIEVVPVTPTREMLDALAKLIAEADILFMAAAPSDFRPEAATQDKRKDAALTLQLVRTPDILTELADMNHHAYTVGFSVETRDALAAARRKLRAKGLDLIVSNPTGTMHSDSVEATLVFKDGKTRRLERQSKSDFATLLIREVAARIQD